MKKYIILIIPLLLFLTLPQARATYTTKLYTNDLELYVAESNYLDYEIFRNVFQDITVRDPSWYQDYDYAIAEDINNTSRIQVRFIPKNDSRLRYYFAKINDDTSPDIDWWTLIITSSSTNHILYTYTKTGTYVSRTTSTASVSISQAGRVYYTSFKAKTWAGYYTGSTTNQTLVDMGNFETRTLPNYVLVSTGNMQQQTADIIDNATENTNRQLSWWEEVTATLGGWFLGSAEADAYREAILNGEEVAFLPSSNLNIFELTYVVLKSLLDLVIGLVIFIFKVLETISLIAMQLVTTVTSMAIKTASTLTLFNSKLSSTPTFIQPIYQASFTIFPAIMGLSVIKFFIRIFRG